MEEGERGKCESGTTLVRKTDIFQLPPNQTRIIRKVPFFFHIADYVAKVLSNLIHESASTRVADSAGRMNLGR